MNESASSPLYILPLFCFKKANVVSASPGTVSVNLSDDQGRHSQRADVCDNVIIFHIIFIFYI